MKGITSSLRLSGQEARPAAVQYATCAADTSVPHTSPDSCRPSLSAPSIDNFLVSDVSSLYPKRPERRFAAHHKKVVESRELTKCLRLN